MHHPYTVILSQQTEQLNNGVRSHQPRLRVCSLGASALGSRTAWDPWPSVALKYVKSAHNFKTQMGLNCTLYIYIFQLLNPQNTSWSRISACMYYPRRLGFCRCCFTVVSKRAKDKTMVLQASVYQPMTHRQTFLVAVIELIIRVSHLRLMLPLQPVSRQRRPRDVQSTSTQPIGNRCPSTPLEHAPTQSTHII